MTLRSILLVVGALVLTGPASAADGPVSGCSVSAAATWVPVRGQVYRTEAFSNGPTCAQAVVTIVVRAPDGSVAWADAAPGQYLMTFADVRTRQQMARALADWLSQSSYKTARELPPWPDGAQGPQSGEFPFMPEAWIDREYYERARAEAFPLFCYVQGMESLACIVLPTGERMEKIGVQSFPG